jgi:TonB family protein
MLTHVRSVIQALVLLVFMQPVVADETKPNFEGIARYITGNSALEAEFLKAREANILAARSTKFQPLLLKASQSMDFEERVWGLTRLIEAGDLSRYQELAKELITYVRNSVNPGVRGSAHFLKSAADSQPQIIHPSSPFYQALEKTIRDSPTREVTVGLYVVWCYNTLPSQKDLIIEIAKKVHSPMTLKNLNNDPWDDPRFWILTDWALAWGQPEDFDQISSSIADSRARQEFQKIANTVIRIPGFFSCQNESPLSNRVAPLPLRLRLPDLEKIIGDPDDLDFSNIKIKKMPNAPSYPPEARARRLNSTLDVQILVDTNGDVCGARAAPGPFLAFFAPTALEYASRWKFEPVKLNGQAQIGRFLLTIPFRIR